MSVELISASEYTAKQAEVLRLNDLLRRCMLDQRYYALQLARYKRWDRVASIFTALATSSAVAGLTIVKQGNGAIVLSALGAIASLILVVKPFFKPTENIERYSKLHYGFTELFLSVENLLAAIRNADGMMDGHRAQAVTIYEQHKGLALQEDASINWRRVGKLIGEVDQAIPGEKLWLPSA